MLNKKILSYIFSSNKNISITIEDILKSLNSNMISISIIFLSVLFQEINYYLYSCFLL